MSTKWNLRSRALWIGLAKYALGFGLLAYVVWANWNDRVSPDGKVLSEGLSHVFSKPINLGPLFAALAINAVAQMTTFVRWHGLVVAQGLPLSFPESIRLGLIGYFFNIFMPGSVGGDIVKATAMARGQERRTVAVATVMFDRGIGLAGLVVLAAMTGNLFLLFDDSVLIQNPRLGVIVTTATALTLVGLAGWFVLGLLPQSRAERFQGRLVKMPGIGGPVSEVWGAVWLYRKKPVAVAIAMLLAVVGHAGFLLTYHFASQMYTTNDAVSLREHALIVPVVQLVKAVPLTPGGAGVGEYTFGKLYTLIGRDESLGVSASFGQLVVTWISGLIGWVIVLLYPKKPAD